MSEREAPRATDRGTWQLVARRDFRVRLRDKGFVISTSITLVVLTVFILIQAYGGGGPATFDLGLLGPGSDAVGRRAVQAASAQGLEVRTREVSSERAARAALRDGSLDAVLVDGERLIANELAPAELRQSVTVAVVATRIQDALTDAEVAPERVAEVLDPRSIPVSTLEPADPNRESNSAVAFVAVLLLYGQLFGYGVWVATGVIEEKSSRVVEVLLSAISPRQLLAGKIVGIGLLGLCQLAVIATYAIVVATTTGALDLPADALGIALIAIGWFVFGFAFYASLFAVSGALVSRMEELQNALVPINLLVVASFFISITAVSEPDTTLARVASLLPFSSALAMPVRIALGSATGFEIAAALVILIGSSAVLVPLAGRLYSGAVLRIGPRVRLRDAWRAAA